MILISVFVVVSSLIDLAASLCVKLSASEQLLLRNIEQYYWGQNCAVIRDYVRYYDDKEGILILFPCINYL